ncbi:MAG TPA: lipopolysaccharide kinase InaA family protein [Gemmataceae bacterium]|nr:lipopolysaccharide kinase InaA family protein [Gemmataceae bacterium]
MNPFLSALAVLTASCLILGLRTAYVRGRRSARKRGFLEVSPCHRSFFRQLGLTEARHFLALTGEKPHIVSGHPDRHVARVQIGEGSRRWIAYLKREHRVTWRTRLSNALAGFGLVSRSLREARTLQTLQREGIHAPEWLAAGEDGQGRAFLLVREVTGVELRGVLQTEKDPRRRRRIARQVGVTLARLHTAGFRHPDLYANHLFIEAKDDSIHVLDWQRSRLMRTLTWQERQRDLAALHATVDAALATPRERLICLRAYRRASPQPRIRGWVLLRGIETQARRLLTRRHIREKRQPPTRRQAWICLEGEALCVTPAMQQRCGERMPDWLPPNREPGEAQETLTRRWPNLPDETRTLLVQRRGRKSLAERLRRQGSFISPEQRQASLLLRLQRHGVTAPQVLALGRRHGADGEVESFLLTEPLTDTCSLEAWLACQTRRRTTADGLARRWSVLRQAGALLQNLHEASCYLDIGSAGCGLAVRQAQGEVTIVIDRVETVTPRRHRQPGRAARDMTRMQQVLHAAGCTRTDLSRFRAGYRHLESAQQTGETHSPRLPAQIDASATCDLALFSMPQAVQSGPDSLWRRLRHGIRRLCHRVDWPLFTGPDWADHIMDVTVTDRFHAKQGRSTGRWVLRASAEDDARSHRLAVYLKRHYELPWWQGLLATLWPRRGWSPALQEWQHLEWARQQGVPVPEVVAAAEYIGPRGKLRSFLAVEELAGMLCVNEAISLAAVRQDAALFRQWKRTLAAEMARLARMLHDRRCFHKDLYLCHFYIARDDTFAIPLDGWRGRVYLIDLHRLAHHPRTWRIWQTKDLAQLLYSSDIVGVDARDRLYFWRAYRGPEPRRPGGGWLRRFVRFKWQRYRHHNARNMQARKNA